MEPSRRNLFKLEMNVSTFKSNLFKRVGESGRELSVATELLDELEVVGAMLPLLVDVRDAAQQGIEDDLRVVLEEVDLKRKKKMDIRTGNFC